MGGILSVNLAPYVHGHLAMLYHVSRDPELTTASDTLQRAIIKYNHNVFI